MNTGIYILQKIRNYANLKIQNGKTLPKLNIGIYSKFGQYYRYDITMYVFIHIIQFLISIWSWISKMMLENQTFFTFLLKCCFLCGFWKTYFLSGKGFPLIGKNCCTVWQKLCHKIQKKIDTMPFLVPWLNCHLNPFFCKSCFGTLNFCNQCIRTEIRGDFQDRHGRFLAGKAAMVAANSSGSWRCCFCFLILKSRQGPNLACLASCGGPDFNFHGTKYF